MPHLERVRERAQKDVRPALRRRAMLLAEVIEQGLEFGRQTLFQLP